MNLEHLKAIFTVPDYERFRPASAAVFDGKVVTTNNHILVATDMVTVAGNDETSYAKGIQDAIIRTWPSFLKDSLESKPLPVSDVIAELSSGYYARQIGDNWINEAYFRAIHSEGITWKQKDGPAKSTKPPLFAMDGDDLIAVAMPLDAGFNPQTVSDVPDSLVFKKFANVANDYYLQDKEVIANEEVRAISKEIAKLTAEIETCNDKIDSLGSEVIDLESDLEDAEKRLAFAKGRLSDKLAAV